ncbi:hypothetical protein EVAR_85794_1 [Eumeta japonica]|uniref:Histone-lysine N-methyltransferase SETMAR n=1 Tax=Eumeta variegata TaxID=151549 RepID=A0A4C1UQ89_EUMVA|nr:hypothetical protein EVAR_85794_1 [Eumeta japonica]
MKPGSSIRSESKQESMQWTKKEKGRRRNSRHERQSYRSDVESYRAECCFTRQCICPHGAVSRQTLKDTGFSELDHPPYSPDLAQRLFPFPI